nr:PP1b [Serpentovirales sp.]
MSGTQSIHLWLYEIASGWYFCGVKIFETSTSKASGSKKLIRSAIKQVTADFELTHQQINSILQLRNPIKAHDHDTNEKHWVFTALRDCGIKALKKTNTTRIYINNELYLLKVVPEKEIDHEINCYNAYKYLNFCIHHEKVVLANGVSVLVRGPTTPQSLGDLVYSHFANTTEDAPKIPDKGDTNQTSRIQSDLREQLINCFDSLDRLRNWCIKENPRLPITLDNIDLNGKYMDFGDTDTGYHNIDNALADLMRLWSLTHSTPPECVQNWFPKDTDLVNCSWLDKILRFNNNLLHATTTATELFIDSESGFTTGYFNECTGTSILDIEAFKGLSAYSTNLFRLQDPGLRFRRPVLNTGTVTQQYSEAGIMRDEPCRSVYYDEDAHQYFNERLDSSLMDDVYKYTYFQGTNADVKQDFMFYDYQGKTFFQPAILKFLFEQSLKDFGACATDVRFSLDSCKPRNSSLGASHYSLMSVKQKALYDAAPDNFIDELVNLSHNTPLIFTTKIIQKFALTAKARARTVAACSMFSSTLFRALHKPVTASFVSVVQDDPTQVHHLIGISKFHKRFDKYIKSRYGDLSDYYIFGSDYTKCDRSFPSVLRVLAACVLYELGGWEPETYHLHNEIHAFIFDKVECNARLYDKPGGTSSGDATTAFANTIYNHCVHLLVQLQTILTSPVHPNHSALKVAACQAWQTGDFTNYKEIINHYNDNIYRFNFLSDDSFILTSKQDTTVPQIFTKTNFARKLETIIHTTVDEGKSWSDDNGVIHEFCSARVQLLNGVYQYIPDKARVLAALIIHGTAIPDDIKLVRVCALLSEAVIYSQVDAVFWSIMWGYFQNCCDNYIMQYGCLPFPPSLTEQEFYFNLISDADGQSEARLMEIFGIYDIDKLKLQSSSAYRKCYTCQNPTISCCNECPVPYSLCAYCAYEHYESTRHTVTNLPKCSQVGCNNNCPEDMYYTLLTAGGKYEFATRCKDHCADYAIPAVDSSVRCFKIPLVQQCIKLNSVIASLDKTVESEFCDTQMFAWEVQQSREANIVRLLHESHLLELFNETKEEVYQYTVIDRDANTVHIPNAKYGPTTYCSILDSAGKQRLTCTVDPLGAGVYKLEFFDESKRFCNYSSITRTSRSQVLTDPSAFDLFNKAEFILGPPGTGKTTHFINNYFKHANEFNKIVYCAPTHKLIQDMDDALKDNPDVAIMKSKLNNRVYHHVSNDATKAIQLATLNVAHLCAGCVLLIDECSLATPKQIIDVIVKVRPSRIVIVGDPFQLSPVLPNADFHWSFQDFYLRHLIPVHKQSTLNVCYRCPSEIFNTFAGAYRKYGIDFMPNKQGGEVKFITIPNQGPKPILSVLHQAYNAMKVVSDDFIVITNYREGVSQANAVGMSEVTTIDSSQGLTKTAVAVVIFGNTKFSRVDNRLIVACSRATTFLNIYATQEVHQYIHSNLKLNPSELQANLTRPLHIDQVDLQTVAANINATCVCDIEFYHCKSSDRQGKNFLGVGEINLLTSRQATIYLRPRYNRDGRYEAVSDHNIVVSKPWRYMLRHLPSEEQRSTRIDTFCHFIADTTNLKDSPPIIILYNGSNDLDAMADLTFPSANCHCNEPARFMSSDGPVCQKHAHQVSLTGLCQPRYYMINRDRCLQQEHDHICTLYHGDAHSADVDVLMTSCLLANELLEVVKEFRGDSEWIKVDYSSDDVDNRLFGSRLFINNFHIARRYTPQLKLPSFDGVHTGKYVPRSDCKVAAVRTCHPCSPMFICSNCCNFYNKVFRDFIDYKRIGYERNVKADLQLTPQERQLKLSAELVETPSGMYLKLGAHSGILYPYFQSIDMTVKKAVHETSQAVPLTQVCIALGITCTNGVVHPDLPYKDLGELEPWDVVLVDTVKFVNNIQYSVKVSSKNNTEQFNKAAFMVGCRDVVFTNRSKLPRFQLQQYRDQKQVQLDSTIFSTGRLHTNEKWLFEEENVTNNVHIELGEYSIDSSTIGGMHCFPKAFQDCQYESQQLPYHPLWHLVIVAEKGIKINNSVTDVVTSEFFSVIRQMVDNNTISKSTTISIDYHQVPIMLWAQGGNLKTAYLQAGGRDLPLVKPRKICSGYNLVEPIIQPIRDDIYDVGMQTRFLNRELYDTQPCNISKYVQICNYITDRCKVLPKPRVLNLGAATGDEYNNIPVGALVLNHYFGSECVINQDIRPINHCHNQFRLSGFDAFDLIISDIWSHGDNTELLVSVINERLNFGGTIIWKTTRRSTIHSIDHIARHFGSHEKFYTNVNANSSELFFVFKFKKSQVIRPLQPDVFNQVLHCFNTRVNKAHRPVIAASLDLSIKHKPATGLVVPKWMMSRITPDNWASGKFKPE